MVFLVLMYDTAARCQEMLDLRIQDLVLHRTSPISQVRNKTSAYLPKTAEHLRSYLKKFVSSNIETFWLERPMSPDTVTAFVAENLHGKPSGAGAACTGNAYRWRSLG